MVEYRIFAEFSYWRSKNVPETFLSYDITEFIIKETIFAHETLQKKANQIFYLPISGRSSHGYPAELNTEQLFLSCLDALPNSSKERKLTCSRILSPLRQGGHHAWQTGCFVSFRLRKIHISCQSSYSLFVSSGFQITQLSSFVIVNWKQYRKSSVVVLNIGYFAFSNN